MSRFVLFFDKQRCQYYKFDFITTDGTRYGYPSLYGYDDVKKRRYSYFETEPYGGIPSFLEKLNAGDESVADVLTSDKWMVGGEESQTQKLRILPVNWVDRSLLKNWHDVIIDTAYVDTAYVDTAYVDTAYDNELKIVQEMIQPWMEKQICLNCGIGFLVMSCENFVEETNVCKGCDTSHCCRECGSYNTRPKTKQENIEDLQEITENKGMFVHPQRAFYQCGDCDLKFTQNQCASHVGSGTTCEEDCLCDYGGAKDCIHRCPTCLTLNSGYVGSVFKR